MIGQITFRDASLCKPDHKCIGAYIVGNHGPGRTDGSSLAIRNDTPLGVTGPLVYNYELDTFSMDYFDVSANTWTNLVPAGTAMGQAMNDFTNIRWQLEDGLAAGVGGKNFFDDFSFSTVPEPSTLLLFAFGGLAITCAMRGRTQQEWSRETGSLISQ